MIRDIFISFKWIFGWIEHKCTDSSIILESSEYLIFQPCDILKKEKELNETINNSPQPNVSDRTVINSYKLFEFPVYYETLSEAKRKYLMARIKIEHLKRKVLLWSSPETYVYTFFLYFFFFLLMVISSFNKKIRISSFIILTIHNIFYIHIFNIFILSYKTAGLTNINSGWDWAHVLITSHITIYILQPKPYLYGKPIAKT